MNINICRSKLRLIYAMCCLGFLLELMRIAFYFEYVKNLEDNISKAEEKIASLKRLLEKNNIYADEAQMLIPEERRLERNLNYSSSRENIQKHVTVLVFSVEEGKQTLEGRIGRLKEEYPDIEINVALSGTYDNPTKFSKINYFSNVASEGEALYQMTKSINTEYFLYLSNGVEISQHSSDQGVGWLYHSLENIPDLDFVGGSYLRVKSGIKYPELEIPCHRLRLCNWTFSQSFEYRYSVGDMMVCQESSSSFMGRTRSLGAVYPRFDTNLPTMATTDFFLRAKGKVLVGLRPEVRFHISKEPAKVSKIDETDSRFPFMLKHQVYILRDSFGREVNAVDSSQFASWKFGPSHWLTNTYANPAILKALVSNLEFVADFLEDKNILYFLDAGITLGGVKVRGHLPWDGRDVDLIFLHKTWEDVKKGLEDRCKERGINVEISTSSPGRGSQNKMELILTVDGLGPITMFQKDEEANSHSFMYLYVHGRRYPVWKHLFGSLRSYYGNRYLEMQGRYAGKMRCSVKGHHACVPVEFANGGGHWRDFYCQT